jgi:hypothetical protein
VQLVRAAAADLSSLRASHAEWWREWWNASAIDLGPERLLLESFWYGMQVRRL